MEHIISIAELVAQILGGICLLATLLVRLTPNKKDDAAMNKFYKFLNGLYSFLPTLGVNPNTKKLQEALAEANAKLEAAGIK